MSTYRERERPHRSEKTPTEVAKKPKREISSDRRPIITQEKPAILKPSATSLKEKVKTQSEKPAAEKSHKRLKDVQDHKKDRKTTEKEKRSSKPEPGPVKAKRFHSIESRSEKENKIDAIYVKDVLHKKAVKKSEKTTKEKAKPEVSKGKEDDERKVKSRRDRTRTRTLSPTEIKQLIPSKMAAEQPSGGEEAMVVDVVKREEEEVEEMEVVVTEEDYEDDFEDYDSNFEEDDDPESQESHGNSAVDIPQAAEEQPTMSKTPDIKEPWQLSVQKEALEAIKKSIEKENNELLVRRNSLKTITPERYTENTVNANQVIDFTMAIKRQKKTKKAAASRKRGEELLSMITLDAISYSILEIPAIAYDDFMKIFGKSNTKQVHVQTNEDNLDEEIQTDKLLLTNKWTQNPPEYLGSRKNGTEMSFILTKEERLGVGGDVPIEEEIIVQTNTKALRTFLSWASQLVLVALERKSGTFLNLDNMANHSKAIAFGDGFVCLNVNDMPFLKGRSVAYLCLPSKNIGKLLSVHVNKEKSFQKSIICIWSLRELSKPLKILIASNRVSSCCFGLNQGNLVFAGLSDGSICLWDLREPSSYHSRMINNVEWNLQSPTYTTAGNLLDDGHDSPVVAIKLMSKTEVATGFGDFTPMQICSLDENGTIIIWSVIQLEKTQGSTPSDDLGLAHWGRVKLIQNSSFSVFANLREEIPGLYITCKDLLINEAEIFYVANSFGSIYHCSSYGSPMKPKFYVPSKQDAIVETTCLEWCPFNENYFLVGCGDGTVRLHSRHQENPLICFNSNVLENEKEAAIVSLTWMRVRPCVFFTLDSLSRINIWDLIISDMYPELSLVLTEKKITCMRLLPVSNPRQVPYIVIGTEGGNIEIHKLKQEYGCRTPEEVQNEKKIFLKYVSIL